MKGFKKLIEQITDKVKELHKKFKDSIAKTVEKYRKYSFDRDMLLFVKEPLISRTSFCFLFFNVFLLCIICIQNAETQKHINIAAAHYETIKELEEKINGKEYDDGEFSLYFEVGKAVLERDCGVCNKDNICNYIDYLSEVGVVWYPDLIKSCCEIESSFGQSNVARQYNNLFGMDHPSQRQTLSLYRSGRFATFKNWKTSILDRVLWDYSIFDEKVPTKDAYIKKMHTRYNVENPNYKKTLLNSASKYN